MERFLGNPWYQNALKTPFYVAIMHIRSESASITLLPINAIYPIILLLSRDLSFLMQKKMYLVFRAFQRTKNIFSIDYIATMTCRCVYRTAVISVYLSQLR